MPPGGVQFAVPPSPAAIPKNPSSWVFALLVVMDGAVAFELLVVDWPPDASIGAELSTPR